jgi:hypothetical protein
LPGGTGTREASVSIASPQAASAGIELSFRIRPPRSNPDWSIRWMLMANQLGYGVVLTPDSAAIYRLGESIPLVFVSPMVGTISGERWSELRFQWQPGGQLELTLNGEVVAQALDPFAPLNIRFQSLSLSTTGAADPDELWFDDLSVAPLSARTSAPTPQLTSLGSANDTTAHTLRFTGAADALYRVEYSPVLTMDSWILLGEYRADSDGRFAAPLGLQGNQADDWNAAGFFRITRLAP